MNDGLEDTASFASLTNWGKCWRDVARGAKRKSKGGGRAGNEHIYRRHCGSHSPEDTIYSTCWL